MNIIDASYKVLNNIGVNPFKYMEEIGRICYKSEDAITDESSKGFISMINGRGHTAMIEHYIFVLNVSSVIYGYLDCHKAKYINISCLNGRYIISGSLRAFINLRKETEDDVGVTSSISSCIMYLDNKYKITDYGFSDFSTSYFDSQKDILGELTYDELLGDEKLIHGWKSVRFVCDRGVSHEIVRHRVASFAQESTRYCNYVKDKFGNEITVIRPLWLKDDNTGEEEWREACQVSEDKYNKLISLGWKPQQARSVLTTSLKTEIVVTMTFRQWMGLFMLRDSSAAHPQMFELAKPLHNEMVNSNWVNTVI